MRVITQNISQVAADPDGYSLNQNYIADDLLVLDGALASTNIYNGDLEVQLPAGSAGVAIGFTTGATGSVADVTIIGRDAFGNPITEVVTMPGASGTVESAQLFSFIESMTIDGVATNLSVGILAAAIQYTPWTPMDVNAGEYKVTVSVELVSGTVNATLEHTIQGDLLRNGPEPDNSFDEGAPFAGLTASVAGVLEIPVTASRLRINSGSAAVLRVKYLQQGAGNK